MPYFGMLNDDNRCRLPLAANALPTDLLAGTEVKCTCGVVGYLEKMVATGVSRATIQSANRADR